MIIFVFCLISFFLSRRRRRLRMRDPSGIRRLASLPSFTGVLWLVAQKRANETADCTTRSTILINLSKKRERESQRESERVREIKDKRDSLLVKANASRTLGLAQLCQSTRDGWPTWIFRLWDDRDTVNVDVVSVDGTSHHHSRPPAFTDTLWHQFGFWFFYSTVHYFLLFCFVFFQQPQDRTTPEMASHQTRWNRQLFFYSFFLENINTAGIVRPNHHLWWWWWWSWWDDHPRRRKSNRKSKKKRDRKWLKGNGVLRLNRLGAEYPVRIGQRFNASKRHWQVNVRKKSWLAGSWVRAWTIRRPECRPCSPSCVSLIFVSWKKNKMSGLRQLFWTLEIFDVELDWTGGTSDITGQQWSIDRP